MKPELLANVMTATMPAGSGDWLGLSFNEQCRIAMDAKPGDIWKSKATGRIVTVIGNSHGALRLKHETGRVTEKQHHYFAYDYSPNDEVSHGGGDNRGT